MRPFVRVKMLNSEDYKQLRELAKSRKLPAGKVRRARIILLSNQGYTATESADKLWECAGSTLRSLEVLV